jgi:putative ABC transport system permease protein
LSQAVLLPLVWAGRELRGGLRGFGIFLACLALGVAVIGGIGSIAASIAAGLAHDAKALLGGDVELHLVHRTATPAELAFMTTGGSVSRVAEMRAMARNEDGSQVSLIELRAVDRAYPLFGAVSLLPAIPLRGALAEQDGHWGAVAAPDLIARLHLHAGDVLRVGEASFVLRAELRAEPDTTGASFALGPHVLVASRALAATGLILPGTLVDYAYRIRFKPGIDADAWIARLRQRFPQAGWRIRRPGEAAENLSRLMDRVSLFLTLVGLTALLVGGVGIANAVRAHLSTKLATIAVMKSLGAPSRAIFATYLIEVLVLAALGIAIGLVLGAGIPLATLRFLPASLAPSRAGIYPGPLALAALFGLLTVLAFALWPVASACETQPAALFRATVEPPTTPPRWPYRGATIGFALALGALAVLTANATSIALWFILGAVGTLLLFRLLALALMFAARHIHPRGALLRLALSNIDRRGAPTGAIVASLGLGLAVLVAIALTEANFARLLDQELPDRAPTFFFIDLQPDQKPAFDRLLASMSGVREIEATPSLRGRIEKLNGVPARKAKVAADVRWTLGSDRGLTYAATLPKGSRIVAGHWWPANYRGPPLVSMDAGVARGLGLKLGDTLTVDVLGRAMTARLTSLRAVDWTSLGINFIMVFSPGALAGAPATYIVTARTTPAAEAPLERLVAAQFPNISSIPVRQVLDRVGGIVAAVAIALRATAAVALIAGMLVLAGAVAAGQRRRIYQAVLLKVLGATRGMVTRAFLIEFGLLGTITAAIAIGVGTIAADFVLTRAMRADFVFAPRVAIGAGLVGAILTLAIGYVGTFRALGARPAPYLSNE